MDQKSIGIFIAQLRKEKNWSQAELGAKLGVTNKTVSRWECGNYLPDIALLLPLCQALGITINELLSAKRLDETQYRQEAEENLLSSLKREHLKQRSGWMGFLEGGGVGILLSTINMPPATGRTVSIILSIAMILSGWLLRERYERRLIARAQTDRPDETD